MVEERNNHKKILFVLFLGVLMGALDIAIVGPALQPIKTAFNISTRAMTAIFTVYVLMNLVGTPILAKFADTTSRRTVYLFSITLFAFGSMVVASAPTFHYVLAGRALQGFGAAGIFPVAAAVIADTFDESKRGRYLGLIGAVFGIAFIIGPIVGGILLLASWHWIFLINLPIAALLLYLANKHLPKGHKPQNSAPKLPFDLPGTITLSLMLAAFVYGISQIDTKRFFASIQSEGVWPYLLTAVLLLVAVIAIERRAKNPIVAPLLFSKKQLNITHALAINAGLLESAMVFIPGLTVMAFGVSSSNSSFLLLPAVFAIAVGSPLYGRLLDKIGARPVILTAISVLLIGLLVLTIFMKTFWLFILATCLIGFGMAGLLGAPLRYILLKEVSVQHRSSAQGVMSLFTSTGQLIGAAMFGAIIASEGGALRGYTEAYGLIALLGFLIFLLALQLKRD